MKSVSPWICFALIALSICLAYGPSLHHMPRGDHLMYLAEADSRTSLWDLTIGSIDLNRTRAYGHGDEVLFRPVIYVLLGLEKYFFGYNFASWQLLGIALHIVVTGCLLRLFLTLYAGWASVCAALFFGLLFVNSEMVTWHHINGYMVFAAMVCVALRHCYLLLGNSPQSQGSYKVLWAALCVAAFTYEMGIVIALLIAAALWNKGAGKEGAGLLVIPALYGAASVLNAQTHPALLQGTAWSGADAVRLIKGMIFAPFYWLYVGLCPFKFFWQFAARSGPSITPPQFIDSLFFMNGPALLGVSLAGLYSMAWISTVKNLTRAQVMVCAIAWAALLGFAVIIFAGRGRVDGIWNVVQTNMHYFYMAWLFAAVALFFAVDWKAVSARLKGCVCVLLVCLAVLNGMRVYGVSVGRAVENQAGIALIARLESLVRQHGREPDFSFYVDPHYPGNFLSENIYRRGDPPGRKYTLIEALYPRYHTAHNPKYSFSLNKSSGGP